MSSTAITSDIADYYSGKIKQFGATNLGVDWSTEASQQLRFLQLSKAIHLHDHFSVLDLGCGYGAYLEYLNKHFRSFNYIGVDISAEMIAAANNIHANTEHASFNDLSGMPESVDFGVASGIFNVMLNHERDAWEQYILETLHSLDKVSRKAFAFNCLTTYSDKEYMKDNLYYANPMQLFDYCKQHFSRNVALLHDYNLYEFTIIVRKYYD